MTTRVQETFGRDVLDELRAMLEQAPAEPPPATALTKRALLRELAPLITGLVERGYSWATIVSMLSKRLTITPELLKAYLRDRSGGRKGTGKSPGRRTNGRRARPGVAPEGPSAEPAAVAGAAALPAGPDPKPDSPGASGEARAISADVSAVDGAWEGEARPAPPPHADMRASSPAPPIRTPSGLRPAADGMPRRPPPLPRMAGSGGSADG